MASGLINDWTAQGQRVCLHRYCQAHNTQHEKHREPFWNTNSLEIHPFERHPQQRVSLSDSASSLASSLHRLALLRCKAIAPLWARVLTIILFCWPVASVLSEAHWVHISYSQDLRLNSHQQFLLICLKGASTLWTSSTRPIESHLFNQPSKVISWDTETTQRALYSW